MKGHYTKYNSNNGHVHPSVGGRSSSDPVTAAAAAVAQAFTHFTYEELKGQQMVCDIQGCGQKFTDPQVLSLNKSHGPADTGRDGMQRFFDTHRCGQLCYALGLQQPETGSLYTVFGPPGSNRTFGAGSTAEAPVKVKPRAPPPRFF